MGRDNTFNDPSFNLYGSGMLDICDRRDPTIRIPFGRCTGVEFTKNLEYATQEHQQGGMMIETDRRMRRQTMELTFNQLEVADPNIDQVLHGDRLVAQETTTRRARLGKRRINLYGENAQTLPHPVLVDSDSLGQPVISLSLAGGALSTQYYVWAVPLYGTLPTISTYNEGLGVSFIAGTPSASDTETPSSQLLVFSITPPTTGPTPDGYALFMHTADVLGSASLAVVTAVVGGSITAAPAGDAYVAQGAFVTGYPLTGNETGGFTEGSVLTKGTDFDVDEGTSQVWRIEGGALESGELLMLYYWYLSGPGVTTIGGRPRTSVDHRRFVFTALEECYNEEGELICDKGTEITFYKVQTAGAGAPMGLQDADFAQGGAVTFPVLYDVQERAAYRKENRHLYFEDFQPALDN